MELKKGTKILLKNHEFKWFDSYGIMKRCTGKIVTVDYICSSYSEFFVVEEVGDYLVWDKECIEKIVEYE